MIYILSYLIGSIPFGFLIARFIANKNIQKEGSGNIGATNITRILGKKYGFLTLVLDCLKGVLVFYLASKYDADIYLASYLVIIGHIFPVWLKFKGGKGVATTISVIFCISPVLAVLCLIVWMLTFIVFRISSISAIISAISAPFIVFFLNEINQTKYFIFLLSLTLLITHVKNISRLLRGKETRFNNFFKVQDRNEKTK